MQKQWKQRHVTWEEQRDKVGLSRGGVGWSEEGQGRGKGHKE